MTDYQLTIFYLFVIKRLYPIIDASKRIKDDYSLAVLPPLHRHRMEGLLSTTTLSASGALPNPVATYPTFPLLL